MTVLVTEVAVFPVGENTKVASSQVSDKAGSTNPFQLPSPMATNYELPEEVNEERLRTLEMEVEMKTFKTNWTSDGHWLVKIICVGNTCPYRKGMFINDYCQIYRKRDAYWLPLIGVDFQIKIVRRQRSEAEEPLLIKLQLWEMAEDEIFSERTKVYYKGSQGTIAFWRTRNSPSLERATKCWQEIRNYLPSIPCVLVIDNTGYGGQEPLQWIGPGKIFESDAALDQFCKDHGFVDHFEIKSRDWISGENSVFGQAVNCLLDEIFQNKKKEASIIS